MRILIDASMTRGGGGFTYLVNILPRIAKLAPNDVFRVYVRGSSLRPLLPEIDNLELIELPNVGLLGRFWSLFVDGPKRARAFAADVYYAVAEYCPAGLDCPTVISFRNPNTFTDLDQGWPIQQQIRLATLYRLALWASKTASRVLFVSADSASWIGDSIDLPERKRAVVQHGIDLEKWSPDQDVAHLRDSDPQRAPVILSVSTIYRYKNFVRLIEAYALLVERDVRVGDLVIVGDDQDAWYSDRMREARKSAGAARDRIQLVGAVPYAKIVEYYHAADLFVFPSYLETFGHPLLEAMASDLPVIAGDIPVFREVGGDAALYVDPYDANAIADAIESVVCNPDRARDLRARAKVHLAGFGWDRSAKTLLKMLHEVAVED